MKMMTGLTTPLILLLAFGTIQVLWASPASPKYGPCPVGWRVRNEEGPGGEFNHDVGYSTKCTECSKCLPGFIEDNSCTSVSDTVCIRHTAIRRRRQADDGVIDDLSTMIPRTESTDAVVVEDDNEMPVAEPFSDPDEVIVEDNDEMPVAEPFSDADEVIVEDNDEMPVAEPFSDADEVIVEDNDEKPVEEPIGSDAVSTTLNEPVDGVANIAELVAIDGDTVDDITKKDDTKHDEHIVVEDNDEPPVETPIVSPIDSQSNTSDSAARLVAIDNVLVDVGQPEPEPEVTSSVVVEDNDEPPVETPVDHGPVDLGFGDESSNNKSAGVATLVAIDGIPVDAEGKPEEVANDADAVDTPVDKTEINDDDVNDDGHVEVDEPEETPDEDNNGVEGTENYEFVAVLRESSTVEPEPKPESDFDPEPTAESEPETTPEHEEDEDTTSIEIERVDANGDLVVMEDRDSFEKVTLPPGMEYRTDVHEEDDTDDEGNYTDDPDKVAESVFENTMVNATESSESDVHLERREDEGIDETEEPPVSQDEDDVTTAYPEPIDETEEPPVSQDGGVHGADIFVNVNNETESGNDTLLAHSEIEGRQDVYDVVIAAHPGMDSSEEESSDVDDEAVEESIAEETTEKILTLEEAEAQYNYKEENDGLVNAEVSHGHDHDDGNADHDEGHAEPEPAKHGDTEEDAESKKRTAIIIGVAVGAVAVFTLAFFMSRKFKNRKFKVMKKVSNGDTENGIEFRPLNSGNTGIYDDNKGTNGIYRQGPKMGPPSPRFHIKDEGRFEYPETKMYAVPTKASQPKINGDTRKDYLPTTSMFAPVSESPSSATEPLLRGIEDKVKYIDDSTDDEYVTTVRERLRLDQARDPNLGQVEEETFESAVESLPQTPASGKPLGGIPNGDSTKIDDGNPFENGHCTGTDDDKDVSSSSASGSRSSLSTAIQTGISEKLGGEKTNGNVKGDTIEM